MSRLYVSTDIYAPRSQVWHALMDKRRWRRWNTVLYDQAPTVAFSPSASVKLAMRRLPNEAKLRFTARVVHFHPEVCLRWVAIAPGYRSEHQFELETADGITRYHHQEIITGAMSKLIVPFIRQDELRGLRRMALDLKQYVEDRQD